MQSEVYVSMVLILRIQMSNSPKEAETKIVTNCVEQ